VVERFRDVVGFGSIHQKGYGPRLWAWDAGGGFQWVQALGAAFWPWLGGRRRTRWLEVMRDTRVDRRRGTHPNHHTKFHLQPRVNGRFASYGISV